MTNSLSAIKMLYDYNHWANAKMLTACEALTIDQWDRDLGYSWGSVHGLLTHMFAAETVWLARWQGNSPQALRQAADFPTYRDLRRAWEKLDAEINLFIDSCDEKILKQEITYTNTKGESRAFPLGHLMLHLSNHSTHHRGELAAMLAIMGVPHPEDDLLWYLRELKEGK
ncbi:MAG: DinB family protein [Chloroflexi bacterium]|nr:DinB family protein [Chloroflexota bacterium]